MSETKKVIGIVLILLLLFLGYTKLENKKSPQEIVLPKVESQQKSSSSYIEYTPTEFEKYSDKRRVLYFYANWCSTCRPANADFLANSDSLPNDVVVFRVNYNDSDTDENEKSLAKKYSVNYQHTFVQVDRQGNVITQWNGGELADLINRIKP